MHTILRESFRVFVIMNFESTVIIQHKEERKKKKLNSANSSVFQKRRPSAKFHSICVQVQVNCICLGLATCLPNSSLMQCKMVSI